MLSFKQFLYELFFLEEISSSDDKGKLHELLVAHHLSSDDDDKKELPTHYRDENGKTPRQVHDEIKSRVSEEDYNKAHKRAKAAAEKIKEEFKKKGIHQKHIKKVVWTSNKSDHKKFTGEDDPNSDADVMIETQNHPEKYHGISLKVGSAKPNLRNPGIEHLNKLTKANKEHVSNLLKNHKNKLHELGYNKENSTESNHKKYKEDKGGQNVERAKKADESKLNTLKHLASHYTESFNNLSHEHHHHMLTSLLAPKTKFPHVRVHTKTPKKGDGPETHIIENHQEELQKELSKHKHGFVAVNKGQRMVIHAKNEDGTPNLKKKIASITMKGVSGPVKGLAAATKQEF